MSKPSPSFAANVLKLVTGNVFAQGFGVLVVPIVARLFAPEAFGVAALFTSIAGIIGVVVCLRYELAIMLPKTDEEAANLLGLSLFFVLIITGISALIIFFTGDVIVNLLNSPELKKYLWLIPLSVFVSGTFLALNYWNSRTKHFGRLSIARVISSVATQTTKLGAGFAGFVSGGVLIGTGILGQIVSTFVLGGQIWRDDRHLFKANIRWKKMIAGLKRHRKFPIIDTWGGLINSISWQLPALMLSSFFSIAIVGNYALGLAVIKGPLGIISGALSKVFYQRVCDEKNAKRNNDELVEKLMDKLMFIGILPTMILTLVGEELFTVIFGQKWFEAGRYMQILSPWIFFWFISSPLSSLFSAYERQGTALSVHSVILITRGVSLYIGGIYQNIYLALGLFSISGILAYTFVAAWNIKLAQANGRKILFTFFKYTFYSFPVCFCLFLIKYIFQFNSIVILSASLIMVSLYMIIFRNKIISSIGR